MLKKITSLMGVFTLGLVLSAPTVVFAAKSYETALKEKIIQYQDKARLNLEPYFKQAGVPYLPKKIKFLAFKQEKVVELWAENEGKWVFITDFPVLAASGHSGPKLREGDRQVPEGVYKFTYLNPYSRYDVSMKINYPDAFDKKFAEQEGRKNLGGDIFMHGSNLSLGCLAMGDDVIEDLFVLVYKVGLKNASIVIAPNDLRRSKPIVARNHPRWIRHLHNRLLAALEPFQD